MHCVLEVMISMLFIQLGYWTKGHQNNHEQTNLLSDSQKLKSSAHFGSVGWIFFSDVT